MKTRFQFGLFALALLMAGCGGNKGGEPAADRPIIQMDSIDYPDLPDGATIRMSKSDFPKGKIRSIEQIPIEGLEMNGDSVSFQFKWADNMQKEDPMDWYVNGDTAPGSRFNYIYKEK